DPPLVSFSPSQQALRHSKLSLRFKATIAAIALTALPILTVGFISYRLASKSMQKKIIAEQEGRTIDLAHEVGIFTQQILEDTQAIASSPLLTDPKFSRMIAEQDRVILLNSLINAKQEKYDNIAIFNLQGKLLFQSKSAQPLTEDRDYSQQKYFQRAIATREPVFKNSQSEDRADSAILTVAAPIKEKGTGKPIGMVVTRMSLEKLDPIFEHIVSEGWEFKLIDTEGIIFWFGSLREEDLMENEVGSDIDSLPSLRAKVLQKAFSGKANPQDYSHLISTEVAYDRGDNQDVLVSFIPLRAIKDLMEPDWGLATSRYITEAFAPIEHLRLTLLLGSAVAATVVGAIAAWLVNRAMRPIVSAAGVVEKIGQGNLNIRLSVRGSDEIGMLFGNINHMASQLKILLDEQAISASQSRFLAEITGASVVDQLELERLFERAVAKAREILQLDRMLIYRINSDGSGYVNYESVANSFPRAYNYKELNSYISQQLVQEYCTGQMGANTDITQAGLHPQYLQLLERLQVKADLVVPLIQQGQLYGLLMAHHCQTTHSWQTREINFIKQLAAELEVTLDRLALLEEREKQVKRSELLKDMTLKISGSFKIEEIFKIGLRQLRKALEVERAIVLTYSDEEIWEVIAEVVDPNYPAAIGVALHKDCLDPQYFIQNQQDKVKAIASLEEANLSQEARQELQQFRIEAYLAVPIVVGNSFEALLMVNQCDRPHHWHQSEIDFISQVATQVGIALERIDLMEQQRIAKEELERRALELLQEVDPISDGDLTISARVTPDEIGTVADFYNATIENLRLLVTQVKATSTLVATTTKNNQTSVKALSQGARQQSEELEAALNRIQEMANSISEVASNAAEAASEVQQASLLVREGEIAMNRTVEGMVAIRQTVAATAKKLKRLGESSQKISKVVNLISKFAEQTNLLALNASIEAAHAGEQGKGFAVVADQVRNLARQSALASEEIEQIVEMIQTETNQVVAAMEAGTAQVVAGTDLVDETRYSLEKIASASTQINQLVEAIAKAAADQSQEERAVSQTMVEVAAISQQTSAAATSVSDSFEELLAVAEKLQTSVDRFIVQ
ncbi:MAG: methyl-accepting chemotaxis protein, partial [Prochloraceae cyanobacterium]